MGRKDFRLVSNVPLEDILLDEQNARIRAGTDQADCIARILRKEEQLMTLMESIASEGLTTMPILVSPQPDKRWVVKDGNRRVTALKLLHKPALCPDPRLTPRIRALATKYKANIVAKVDVLSSDDEQAIVAEVVSRHSGAQGGAGQLDWSAYLRTVYLLHHGHTAEYKRPAQYVFWAEEQGVAVEDDFPISTVQRFFTLDNLALLGFKVEKDELVPSISVAAAKSMAQRVINDFQLGRDGGGKAVDDVRTPQQAKAYIEQVRAAAGLMPSPAPAAPSPAPAPASGPSPSPAGGSATGGTSPPSSATTAAPTAAPTPAPGTAPTPSPRTPPSERNKLFGRTSPNIAVPDSERKVATIVAELRILNVKDTPLAVAGLLRQLVETSDERYRRKHTRPDRNSLQKNVLSSATRMRDASELDAAQFDIVSRLATPGSQDLLHIETLQKVMHRDTHHPSYQTLNTFWDSIAPFVRACWAK